MGQLILLAAVAHRRVIGQDNDLPWHLPEDLKRFKSLTTGHVVAMGRKTFQSIIDRLGRPLPNRRSVVLTRSAGWRPDWPDRQNDNSVSVLHDVAGLEQLSEGPVFVIGGAEIYAQTISHADILELTEIDLDVPGDAFFPEIDPGLWQGSHSEWLSSEKSGLRYRYVQYRRTS